MWEGGSAEEERGQWKGRVTYPGRRVSTHEAATPVRERHDARACAQLQTSSSHIAQRSPTGDSTVRACVRPNNVQPSTSTVGDSQESLNLVLSESRALAIRRYACMGRPGLDSDTVQRQRISEMGERNAHTRHIGIYSKTHRPASNRPWPDDRQESSGFSTRLSEAARAPVPPTRVCTEIP